MSTERIEKSTQLFSKLEKEVFSALRGLPSGYEVRTKAEAFTFNAGGLSYPYEPYLVVLAPDGRRLVVEVKSHYSLSMANMAQLTAIQRGAASDGAQFLVIVPDATEPANKSMLFGELHIAYGQGTGNVVPVVLDALNSQTPSVGAGADAPQGAAVSTAGR